MSLFVALETFIFLASIAIGVLLILRPARAIELQKRFYFRINWCMEPVNMALEIRNIRMMGFMIMGVVTVFVVFLLIG